MELSTAWLFLTKEELAPYREQFELPNIAKQKASARGQWWWNKMPDKIEHYKQQPDGTFKIPVGLAGFVPSRVIRSYDSTVIEFPALIGTLKPQQLEATDKLLARNYGLLHASTGTGKTWITCEILRRCQRRTLIVTDSISRMTQMVSDIATILGIKPDYIGGTKPKSYKPDTTDIVVLSIDSRHKLTDLASFSTIVCDEADRYLNSDARREWIGTLAPEFMYALTGTIRLNDVHDGVFKIYYGPKTEFLLKHYTPTYYQVLTTFCGDPTYDPMTEFHLIKEELYWDQERNDLIVDTVRRTLGNRKGLVFCQYIEHAKQFVQRFEALGIPTRIIIGEVKDSERERIREELKAMPAPCLLIGSVQCVGRGFDVPELSAAYLTTCEKFDSNITQYLWRIVRAFPWKTSCDFYDFVDTGSGVLMNQAKKRVQVAKREFKWITVKQI